jgi:hypothetical protein
MNHVGVAVPSQQAIAAEPVSTEPGQDMDQPSEEEETEEAA